MTFKKCGNCGAEKSTSEFYASKTTIGGFRGNCKSCHRASVALWDSKNGDKRATYTSRWQTKNPDKCRAYAATDRKNSTEKRAIYDAAWQKKNPDKVAANSARRKAEKIKRTPPWLTELQRAEIAKCYKQASVYSVLFDVQVHVDHILPLQGKTVSGLHVPWNLRIIKSIDNMRKGVKVFPLYALSKSLTFEDEIAR